MNILIKKQPKKYLIDLNDSAQERIEEAIDKLQTLDGDIKKMKGEKDLYRLRVGDYRVLFKIEADNIIITKIGPRGDVYK